MPGGPGLAPGAGGSEPAAKVDEPGRLEPDLVEGGRAPAAQRRLRLEADCRLGACAEGEMADEPPVRSVCRGVERKRRPDPGEPEPDRSRTDRERVRVVREASGDDRDDHRLSMRRVLQGELRPAIVAGIEHERTRVERGLELDTDTLAEHVVAAGGCAD